MVFEIVEVEELSSDNGHLYSVILDNGDNTLLDEFFETNRGRRNELNDLLERLMAMKNKTGFRRDFFTHNEGSPGDGIAVLKSGSMRLYCIYFDKSTIIVGGGGIKKVRVWQSDDKLSEVVQLLEKISRRINRAIKEREIVLCDDGTLEFNEVNKFEL